MHTLIEKELHIFKPLKAIRYKVKMSLAWKLRPVIFVVRSKGKTIRGSKSSSDVQS